MKVLHITYDMRIGGTEMVIKNIIEGNNPDDITMSIYCLETPLGPWGKALQQDGIEITTTPRQPGFDTRLIKAIRQHIKQHNIDIVHCHQYTPWVYGTLAALMTSAKVIFTEHGRFYPDSSSWKRRIINPLLCMATHAITAISEATRQALTEYEFIPAQKIAVIYNGIAPLQPATTNTDALRASLGIAENALIFGTIARFDPIKNQLMMIRAFAKAKASHAAIHLLMVGDGEERERLEAEVERLGITASVTFTGYIPNPAEMLAAMDIFLLSSLSEGTSMTLLEAMSLSKPCIVTHAGGNPEIIHNDYNGLVVPNDNAQAFTEAMCQLIDDPGQRAEFARHAQLRFAAQFNRQHMLAGYYSLYKTDSIRVH